MRTEKDGRRSIDRNGGWGSRGGGLGKAFECLN